MYTVNSFFWGGIFFDFLKKLFTRAFMLVGTKMNTQLQYTTKNFLQKNVIEI